MAAIIRRPYTTISWRRRLIFECRSPSRLSACSLRRRRLTIRASTTTLCRRSTTITTVVNSHRRCCRRRRRAASQRLRNLSRFFGVNSDFNQPVTWHESHWSSDAVMIDRIVLMATQDGR